MNARNLYPPARKNAAATASAAIEAIPAGAAYRPAGPACCCPARPVVRVTMPPAPGRPHRTDLLLCGHHYRASRRALAAAGAVVTELPGTSSDVAAWIHDERVAA